MLRRSHPLIPPALLASLILAVSTPGQARAHRLVLECRALTNQKVQVEAWYNSPTNPHPARQASVQVFQPPDGPLLVEGKLDENGFFVFIRSRTEALKVVVYQTGHREEIEIPAAAPAMGKNSKAAAAPADPPESQLITRVPGARNSNAWIKDTLIGVGFLLALAAFVLSLSNARRLRTLKKDPTNNDH